MLAYLRRVMAERCLSANCGVFLPPRTREDSRLRLPDSVGIRFGDHMRGGVNTTPSYIDDDVRLCRETRRRWRRCDARPPCVRNVRWCKADKNLCGRVFPAAFDGEFFPLTFCFRTIGGRSVRSRSLAPWYIPPSSNKQEGTLPRATFIFYCGRKKFASYRYDVQ